MSKQEFKRNVRIAISSICNLNCIYCEGNSGYRKAKMGAMEDFRKTELKKGNISYEDLIEILKIFRKVGFNGITLTGGEPLLNKDWDKIIEAAYELGFERNEITTNGILLGKYFKEKKKLPKGLSLIKISFDTIDENDFFYKTGGGDLKKVIEAVKIVSPHITVRANKVMLREDIKYIKEYIDFCKKIGFKEIILLDLVIYPNRNEKKDIKFFKEQYVPYEELLEELKKIDDINFKRDKYGHSAITKSGLRIILKDSNLTLRDKQCNNCPLYCQEGKFTVRVATDGNITMCPDYRAELDSIDGIRELKEGTLEVKLKKLYDSLNNSKEYETIKIFKKKHNLLCEEVIK